MSYIDIELPKFGGTFVIRDRPNRDDPPSHQSRQLCKAAAAASLKEMKAVGIFCL
jgi:hypothetical protein